MNSQASFGPDRVGGPGTARSRRLGARLAALVSVVVLGSIAGSASVVAQSAAPAGATPQYSFVGFLENCAFCTTVNNGALQAAKDLGVNVNIIVPGDITAEKQNPALEAAIASQPDAIAFPYFSKGNEPAVLDAIKAGIPMVLYNNNRFEASGDDQSSATTDPRITSLPFVGQNENIVGETLAKALLPSLKSGDKVAIFIPAPGSSVHTLRAKGIERVLDANGITYEELNGTLDETQNATTIGAYYDAHSDLAGVFGTGDPTANAAAAEAAKRGLKIPIGTIDVDSEAVGHIKDGSITAAINQQPFLQGYGAVMDMYIKTVLGLNPVNIDTGTQVVTKDNVADLDASIAAGRN